MPSPKFSEVHRVSDAQGNAHFTSTLQRGKFCFIDDIALNDLFNASVIWKTRTAGGAIKGAIWEFAENVASVPVKLFVDECGITCIRIRSEPFDPSAISHDTEAAFLKAVGDTRAVLEKSAYTLPIPQQLVSLLSKLLRSIKEPKPDLKEMS